VIRRCKSQFNSVKERWCAAGDRAFCSSRNFIGNRNPTGWYEVAAEFFNNVISPKDLEFLWRIGNKLMQLSLCSAVAVTWWEGVARRKFFAPFVSFLLWYGGNGILSPTSWPDIYIRSYSLPDLSCCAQFHDNFCLSNKYSNKKEQNCWSSSIFQITFMNIGYFFFNIKCFFCSSKSFNLTFPPRILNLYFQVCSRWEQLRSFDTRRVAVFYSMQNISPSSLSLRRAKVRKYTTCNYSSLALIKES